MCKHHEEAGRIQVRGKRVSRFLQMGQAASGCLAQAIQSIHVSFALAFVEIWVISGSFLRICSQFPKVPTFIEIPVVSEGGSSDWEMMKVPILDPHRVLHYVHETVGIRIAPDLLEHYWKTAARNGLGWATSQNNMRAVPIGLYADETKYGLHESQEKVLAVFLNMVLFRPKNIRLSRFLIFTLRSRLLLPDSATLYPLFRYIVWSLGWASKGIMPDVSMSGGPLPGDQARHALKPLGASFYVTELRGDLAWHKQIWGFEGSGWRSTDACFFCRATSTGRNQHLLYCKIGENAPWRATIFRDTLEWATTKLNLNRLCNLTKNICSSCLVPKCSRRGFAQKETRLLIRSSPLASEFPHRCHSDVQHAQSQPWPYLHLQRVCVASRFILSRICPHACLAL